MSSATAHDPVNTNANRAAASESERTTGEIAIAGVTRRSERSSSPGGAAVSLYGARAGPDAATPSFSRHRRQTDRREDLLGDNLARVRREPGRRLGQRHSVLEGDRGIAPTRRSDRVFAEIIGNYVNYNVSGTRFDMSVSFPTTTRWTATSALTQCSVVDGCGSVEWPRHRRYPPHH
jgi:hypothetical protein